MKLMYLKSKKTITHFLLLIALSTPLVVDAVNNQDGLSQNNTESLDENLTNKPDKQKNIHKKKKHKKSHTFKKLAICGAGCILGGAALYAGYNSMYPSQPQINPNQISRGNIFEIVTGVKQEMTGLDLGFVVDGNGYSYITNKLTNQHFECGKINLQSIQKLEDDVANIPQKNEAGFFKIIYLNGGLDAPLRRFADIAALQAHPANNDAVFQLASRPNALENFCVWQNKGESGGNFTPFIGNCSGVQGEEGALSAAPGGILRMYGPNSINLFAGIDPDHRIFNPLCPIVPGGVAIDENKDLFNDEGWFNNLVICFHEGIQVVAGLENYQSGNRYNNSSESVQSNQIIHQVPVSAFNFRHDGGHVSVFAQEKAQQLLNASYRGTLLAAIAHKKEKIF